jgi:aldehyde dehydrogenase (NAD+)
VDYVLAHESIKDDLINHLKREVETQYGIDPSKSPYYQRIVDINHTKRIARLLQKENHGGKIQFGGEVNLTDRYISPTIIDEPRANSALMKEEIFGPLLPVLKYKSINYAIKFVNEREKPLALYYFGAKNKQKVLHETSSRAFSANDTLMYMLNNALPFGGVGFSGMSRLHGDYAIDSCSHLKACFDRKIIPYPPFSWSFPPYNNPKRFRLMRWALNMLK